MNFENETENILLSKLNELNFKLEAIQNRLLDIEKKFDEKLEDINKNCHKMDEHIDFVDSVYDNIKNPFHYIMNKVSGNKVSMISTIPLVKESLYK